MFRPGFPRLSHPGLAHATPSTGFIAKVYRGAGKLTDQQRAAQAPGLERRYGSLNADVARGLALRMDHGSQYLSDHFLKQIRYWGIHPSFGFVEEPETNGVAER